MWETCTRKIEKAGGEVLLNFRVRRLVVKEGRIEAVWATDMKSGEERLFSGDYFVSTMPIRELIEGIEGVPHTVRDIAEGLVYRDFITVGLLVRGLKIHDRTPAGPAPLSDNWIYIQEPEVQLGRLQIFNNWSPAMVADPNTVWLGLEYFCNETDDLWKMDSQRMAQLAIRELASIGIIDPGEVLDSTVLHMPKAYPAYFGTYPRFDELRPWLDGFQNLFLVGRNGMHRYNNQDHSMLTAMTAVENIIAGRRDKTNVWEINTEQDYHEQKEGGDAK